MTLLDMTQNILSAMNSDNVNSISDTVESMQVAEAIRTAYINMIDRLSMPEHNQLVQLVASGDSTLPVLMYMPEGCSKISWLEYFNTNPADGNQLQQDQFGAYSHDVNTDLTNDGNGWTLSSLSTNTIQTGSATFTVASGQSLITVGQTAYCYPSIYPEGNNYMYGTVTSYSGTSLVLDITNIVGTANSYSDWSISSLGPSAFVFPGYMRVKIIPVNTFINMTKSLNITQSDVDSFQLTITENASGTPQNFTFYYQNDIQPRHCCILNNYYVIFDSYDNTQDTTLQASKTMAMGWIMPPFTLLDTFTPNLDDQRFSLLLNEAKSLAFAEIKNQPHPKAEKEVVRQLAGYQKYKSVANRPSYLGQLPDFGRRGGLATLGGSPGEWR